MNNPKSLKIAAVFSILFSLSVLAAAVFVFKHVGIMQYILIGVAAADLIALIFYIIVGRRCRRKRELLLKNDQHMTDAK